MKKYAFLLLFPFLVAIGGEGEPEQKQAPAPEQPIVIEIEEKNPWIQVTSIIVGGLVSVAIAYITATGQWTADGRKERKTKGRLKKEKNSFAKKDDEK